MLDNRSVAERVAEVTQDIYELIEDLKLEVARVGEGYEGQERENVELLRRLPVRKRLQEMVEGLEVQRKVFVGRGKSGTEVRL